MKTKPRRFAVIFKLTREQKDDLRRRARASGMSMTEFLIGLLFGRRARSISKNRIDGVRRRCGRGWPTEKEIAAALGDGSEVMRR